jgi:hypothetical protein
MEADTMKRIKEILLIAAILMMPLVARAQLVQIKQPIAAGGGAASITSTDLGSGHKGLDVSLPAGSISVGAVTVNPVVLVSGLFKSCTIPPTSAAACNFAVAGSAWMIFNSSTTGTLWVNPYGTAAVNAGFPITKSGVAYDHSLAMWGMGVQNFSIYNADTATATPFMWEGK